MSELLIAVSDGQRLLVVNGTASHRLPSSADNFSLAYAKQSRLVHAIVKAATYGLWPDDSIRFELRKHGKVFGLTEHQKLIEVRVPAADLTALADRASRVHKFLKKTGVMLQGVTLKPFAELVGRPKETLLTCFYSASHLLQKPATEPATAVPASAEPADDESID